MLDDTCVHIIDVYSTIWSLLIVWEIYTERVFEKFIRRRGISMGINPPAKRGMEKK
jgi:hypothetical protein